MDLSYEKVKQYLSLMLQAVGTISFFTGVIFIFYNTWYWGLVIILVGILIIALSIIVDKRNRKL